MRSYRTFSPLPKIGGYFLLQYHKITPICAFRSKSPFPVRTFLTINNGATNRLSYIQQKYAIRMQKSKKTSLNPYRLSKSMLKFPRSHPLRTAAACPPSGCSGKSRSRCSRLLRSQEEDWQRTQPLTNPSHYREGMHLSTPHLLFLALARQEVCTLQLPPTHIIFHFFFSALRTGNPKEC